MQDAFLSVWANTAESRSVTSGYLRAVVRNRALDIARREQRTERRQQERSSASHARRVDAVAESAFNAPDVLLETADWEAWLERLLAELPEQQLVVFRLHREEGWSYALIARLLGLSTRTVETHMRRALATLRAAWERESRNERVD